jgi:hypothetical protein
MRKVTLLAAATFVAALFTMPTIANAATAKPDPALAAQRNTAKFLQDATIPYTVTSKAAADAKAKAAKGKKKGKKSKRG